MVNTRRRILASKPLQALHRYLLSPRGDASLDTHSPTKPKVFNLNLWESEGVTSQPIGASHSVVFPAIYLKSAEGTNLKQGG